MDVTVDVMGVASVGGPSQPEPAQPVPPYRSAGILWAALSKRSGRPSLESCDAQNQGHIVHMCLDFLCAYAVSAVRKLGPA